MGLLEQKSFIQKITPFNMLDNYNLDVLVDNLDVVYFKENVKILEQGEKPQFLYFIIKGVVQELKDDEVVSVYTNNEFFDPISLIHDNVKQDFKTTEETLCYALKAEVFLSILYQNEELEGYFFQSISSKLNNSVNNDQNKELINFMIARVEDAFLQKPLFCDEDETIFQAVEKLKKFKSSTVLVTSKDGKIGIATDTDFIEKVVLNRLSFDEPIKTITTWGIKTIDKGEFLFNAQLNMNKYGVKRLIVEDENSELPYKIVGILDLISLTSFFASHSYSVILALDSATDISELKKASENFVKVIRTLYAKGVKVRYISKMISQLNNKLFSKLFDLIAPDEFKANVALIIMGSEGRGEQILRTDQDNALIISNSCTIDPAIIEEFTKNFTKHLIDFGYPACEGNIMVSNPFWCKSVDQFKETIFGWIHNPSGDNFMNLAIFFDAVCVCGDETLLNEVKEYLNSTASFAPSFYSFFAKPILSFETPLGLFANFIVDKREHKDELDLKKGGIFPIVHGVRSLALEYNLSETNTVERLKALSDKDVFDWETARELIESFTFLLSLRLKFRLQKIDAKLPLDNYINPSELSILEKDLLKDSFKIVDKFKKYITYHYKLNNLV